MPSMATNHIDVAAAQLARADEIHADINTANLARDWPKAGRLRGVQRAHVKRAEVHALLAIADELSRIGLGR